MSDGLPIYLRGRSPAQASDLLRWPPETSEPSEEGAPEGVGATPEGCAAPVSDS